MLIFPYSIIALTWGWHSSRNAYGCMVDVHPLLLVIGFTSHHHPFQAMGYLYSVMIFLFFNTISSCFERDEF
jgi:hypothetical protein